MGLRFQKSFNVLVKELQGLGLKVDLIDSDKVIDAESILATNISDEATHQSDVDVPAPTASDVDVTEDVVVDEFMVMEDVSDDLDLAGVTADEGDEPMEIETIEEDNEKEGE